MTTTALQLTSLRSLLRLSRKVSQGSVSIRRLLVGYLFLCIFAALSESVFILSTFFLLQALFASITTINICTNPTIRNIIPVCQISLSTLLILAFTSLIISSSFKVYLLHSSHFQSAFISSRLSNTIFTKYLSSDYSFVKYQAPSHLLNL